MKNRLVMVLLLLIMSFAFVFAQEGSADADSADVEELQGIIGQLPFDDSGQTNFSRYKPFKTRAEEKIEAMNTWLDDNAGWMRYLFQMRPQVSLLFGLNLYVILFFFLILVLNGRGLWFFIESANNARLFGAGVFVAFAAIGLYVGLAQVITNFLIYMWHILLATAMWLAVIAMVIFVILLIFLYPVAMGILEGILKYYDLKRDVKKKIEMAASSEAVNKLVEQVTKKQS